MDNHQRPHSANYARLMSELREQLLATPVARSHESGDHQPRTRPLAMPVGDSASSRKDLPTSIASVDMCCCGKHPDVHLHVTLLCTCQRSSTSDASTQTDGYVVRDQQSSCPVGASVVRPLQKFNEEVVSDVRSSQSTASVAKSPSTKSQYQRVSKNCLVPSAGASGPAENASRNEYSQYRDNPLISCETESPEGSLQSKSKARRRMVDATMALVRDTLFEVLRDTPAALATTSTTGIFDTVFPTPTTSPHSSPFSTPKSISSPQTQAGPNSGPVTPAAQEPIIGKDEGNPEPQHDSRRYLVGDELSTIYEHVESRWAEICAQLRANVNNRCSTFLADCRRALESEGREAERAQLLQEMSEARREIMTEIKEEFRTKCAEFTSWRRDYLETELENTCEALSENARPCVLAAVLRYEILDSLPDFEQRTRASAAALWKELIEQNVASVDAILNEQRPDA
ncbi:uncharacterized protein LOC144180313 [Haemaphysalis longicornis]